MGGFLQTRPSKIRTFYLLSWTHEIFKVTKRKGKIIFGKIWGYQKERRPLNEATKILNF